MSSYPGPDDEEEDTEVVDLEDTDEVDEEGYVVDVDDEEDKSFEEELHCSVEGLGCWHTIDNEQIYLAPGDAFECIRDLLRAFREEVGASRRVHRLLGKWGVVEKKLVPMLISHRDDLDDKCFQILRLMVILTMPVNRDTPELDTHLQYLQGYKAAIGLNEDVLTIFMTILDQCIGVSLTQGQYSSSGSSSSSTQEVGDATKRLRAQQQELVFTLVRNLLEIPDPRPGDPGFSPAHRDLQMTMLQELYESGFLDFAVLVMEDALNGPTPTINRNKQLLWLYFEILYHACAKIRPVDLITVDARFKPDLSALINRSILTYAASLPILTRHNRFGKRVAVNMPDDGPSSTKQLIAGRQRHYRNKLVDEAPNVFQDRTFTDVDVGSKVPVVVGDAPAGLLQEVISADGGVSMINLAVWEKFLKSFASFIVDMIDRVFAGIMAAVIKAITDSEVEQEYDVVRALNFIAWSLDFQRQSHEYHVAAMKHDRAVAVAEATQAGTPLPPPVELTEMVIDITSVEPALNVEATELVARQLRVHSKEAKSLKKGGARNVVVLRALLEQIRMIRTCLRSPDKETAHVAEMLLSNVLYEDVQTQLVWLCKTGFKSTVADPRVLTLSVQCLSELLKAMEKVVQRTGNKYKFAAGKRRRRRKGGKKGKRGKSKKSAGVAAVEEEEEQQHMEGEGRVSDSEVDTGDDDDMEEEDNAGVEDYDNIRAADTSAEAILMDLAHTDTINNLMYMLGDGYITNGPSVNRDCVYLLTQILTLRPCNIAFFFQLSHLLVCHKILTDPKLNINPRQYTDVRKFSLTVAKRFLVNAMKNSCVYVEAIFPKLRGGRGGQLMSMEAEFTGILTDYQDDDSKDILERMHEGEAYETMRAAASGKVLEEVSSGPPWSEEEDELLKRLWDEYRHAPDRYGIIAINLPVHDDGYERLASDVKRRLAELGIATRLQSGDEDGSEEDEGGRGANHVEGDHDDDEGASSGSSHGEQDDDDEEEEDGFDIDRIRNLHTADQEPDSDDDAIGFSDDEVEEEEEEEGENLPDKANRVPTSDVPMPDSTTTDISDNVDNIVEAGLADTLPEFEELRIGLKKVLEEATDDTLLSQRELDMLGPDAMEMLRASISTPP